MEVDEYGGIDHLMETSWGQESPWNTATPLTDFNGRCPLGCGAVAVAQVMYYHHYLSGKPQSSLLSASCNDYYNNSPQLIRGSYSSSTWGGMSQYANDNGTTGNQLAAAFLADVAWGVSTYFTPSVSGTSLAYCRDYLQDNSFYCSAANYSDSLVLVNVSLGRPVIIGLDSATDGDPHIAVIDGFIIYRYHYINFYQWMPIGTFPPVEPEYPDLNHPELYEIAHVWGDVSHYGFLVNWGFDGDFDDGIYSNTGFGYANGDSYTRAPILHNIF